MSKLYLFITPTLRTMGGSILYVSAKSKQLREDGWAVSALTIDDYLWNDMTQPIIDDVEFSFYELEYDPVSYRRKRCERVCQKVVDYINQFDYCVLESHFPTAAKWGELIASKTNAKHIVYLINERYKKPSKRDIAFYEFKLARRELTCIQRKGLEEAMGGGGAASLIEPVEILNAFGASDCVANVEFDDSLVREAESCDLKLGSLGRLDKGYIPEMVDSLVRYASQNSDLSISICIVGDTKDPKRASYITNSLNRCKNVSYSMLGVLSPVPEKLIQTWDIAIASAGAACALAEHGVPTVKYSADGQPMGIIGSIGNTDGLFLAEGNRGYSLEFLLDCVRLGNAEAKDGLSDSDHSIDYSQHMAFIDKSSSKEEYFDVMRGFADRLPRACFAILCHSIRPLRNKGII